MLLRRFVLLWLFVFVHWGIPAGARAESMDILLGRLSQGACESTIAPGPITLRTGDQQSLQADERAWRHLATQLSSAVADTVIAPVITSGPVGLDVALETHLTDIDEGADFWARGTRGSSAPQTCEGRNGSVRSLLVSERLHVDKGLPLGFSLGAMVGRLVATNLYLVGASLKFAPLEEVWSARLPDLALRVGLTKTVGADDFSLLTTTLDALLSKRFVIAETTLSPYLGAGAIFTRASTGTIDLTPNIDALACQEGRDPVCNASGLGATSDDLGHDVRFSTLRLLRYRGFGGLALRYRMFALSGTATVDLREPRVGQRGRGERGSRQWTASIAPSVSF